MNVKMKKNGTHRQFLEGAHLHVHLDDLVEICKDYHSRVFKLEGDKWDLERGVKIRILEVWRPQSQCPFSC